MAKLSHSEALPYGLLMVKPHAYDEVLDPLVSEILQGKGLAAQLAPQDILRPILTKLVVGNPIIRDLSAVPYVNELIDLFYGDKSMRRYYPMIRDYYIGKVAIIPYMYGGPAEDMADVYSALKGTTQTYDVNGKQIDPSTGIRGLLGKPYKLYDNESSMSMSDETYRKYFLPVVNNYIHVCDSSAEIDAGLRLVYMEDEWAITLGHMINGNRTP
jgi:hypothetical protein